MGRIGNAAPVPGAHLAGGLEFMRRCAYLAPVTRQQDGQMAKANPLQFMQQVRSEVGKVAWPSRREVMLTTVMVFVMAALTAAFFSIIDILIRTGLTTMLSMIH